MKVAACLLLALIAASGARADVLDSIKEGVSTAANAVGEAATTAANTVSDFAVDTVYCGSKDWIQGQDPITLCLPGGEIPGAGAAAVGCTLACQEALKTVGSTCLDSVASGLNATARGNLTAVAAGCNVTISAVSAAPAVAAAAAAAVVAWALL
jgi:hypothetical protein